MYEKDDFYYRLLINFLLEEKCKKSSKSLSLGAAASAL